LNQPTHTSSNTTMSSQSYSRQYLRELPETHRRQIIQNDAFRLFQQMEPRLKAAALKGETRYLHDMAHWEAQEDAMRMMQGVDRFSPKETKFNQQMQAFQQSQKQAPALPESLSHELLAALGEKFPDCGVSFQEDWVETRQGVRELKKGILIDWS